MGQQSNLSELFKPQDISNTITHAMSVFQGQHDALPELLKDAGNILTKVSRQFTAKQMVLAVGGLAVAAIIVLSLTENSNGHSDNSDNRGNSDKRNNNDNRNQNRNQQ